MVVKDFPNFFMMYGPQGMCHPIILPPLPPLLTNPTAPTSLTNGPPFLEMQAEWILSALIKQRGEKIDTIEPKEDEEAKWSEGVANLANQTLSIYTNSWVCFALLFFPFVPLLCLLCFFVGFRFSFAFLFFQDRWRVSWERVKG